MFQKELFCNKTPSLLLSAGSLSVAALFMVAGLAGCSQVVEHEPAQNKQAAAYDQHTSWRDYGGGPDQSKYVKLNEIDKSNVDQLEVAWTYSTGDDNVYQFNPIVVDNVMYVLAKNNSLIALDATNGEEIWIHANLRGIARRGINYWESEDGKDRRLLFQMNDYLQAIDARTGKSILSFGDNGLVDLREGLDRDPETISRVQSGTPGKIFEDLILLGSSPGENYLSPPGYLRAYNVVTGGKAWTFHTIPKPGEYGYDTWPKDAYKYAGGVNAWGEISIDVERGIAYFPLGSPTYDYYGADRVGSNLYGNSLLALDARSGKRLWHFQFVHHDLWDYDAAGAPQLLTVEHDGKKIDAVAQATKNGFLFAFNRVTGEPLWPIEERPVPPSDVPGEQAWPTQPFPTVLPPISRQFMGSENVSPYLLTDEERSYWKKRIAGMRKGLFMPLSTTQETLSMPGAVGGVSWGNTAANPEEGILYVLSIDWPSFYEPLQTRDFKADQKAALFGAQTKGEDLYVQNCAACHGADRSGGIGPSLQALENRLKFGDFQQVLLTGRGDMPAFAHLNDERLKTLYKFLSQEQVQPQQEEPEETPLPKGPVVASGGAPGGLELRRAPKAGGRLGAAYPEGVEAPEQRYYTEGWGLGNAYVISPPWSSIVAYDLNTGAEKWRRPIGTDLHVAREGGENTGVPHAQRNGMVVTSTGLVFSTAKDGKIYAFDADNGEVLWEAQLPSGTEGLPAMYKANGRHYLVVTATTPLKWGRMQQGDDREMNKLRAQGAYVVFALPQ